MKALSILMVAGALLMVGCSASTTESASMETLSTETSIGLLPGVATFIGDHDEFGIPSEAESMPDWAQGERQRVAFSSGRSLLFYLKDGAVVTVYEDDAESGRVVVWGEYSEAETTETVERSEDTSLPAYTILFQAEKLGGAGRFGDVLVPSVSRQSSATEREALARTIASREGLAEVMLYCTEDAYEANMSSSYASAHPNAMRDGFLGMLKDGVFTAGEVLYP
jgi:hypothetical protein